MNDQSALGGIFTQTALVTTLLPGDPLAVVRMASASVGPNAGPPVVPPAPPAAPTAASLAPTGGPAAGGGTVTVTGTGFVPGATTVQVDTTTVPAGSVTVASPTSLSFAMPAHAAGPVGISVVTAGGTSTALTYTFTAPVEPVTPPPPAVAPTTRALHPASGPSAGGRQLTVTGTGFRAGATTVTIGGTVVKPADVKVTGTTQLRLTTPKRRAGEADVVVSTSAGKSTGRAYAYLAAPTLQALRTATGSTAGGTLVTAVGSGFVAGNTAVRIGTRTLPASDVTVTGRGFVPGTTSVRAGSTTVPAARVHVLLPTKLVLALPKRAAGRVDVQVVTAGGRSAKLRYTYVAPTVPAATAPAINSPAGGTASANPAPFVGGTGAAGSTVTVYVDGSRWCTATVGAGTTWSCAGTTPLLAGAHVLTARALATGRWASPAASAVGLTTR